MEDCGEQAGISSGVRIAPACTASRAAPEGTCLPMFRPLYDVNERCINVLVDAARKNCAETPSLVRRLRGILRAMTASSRARAAQCPLLLVDMQFANAQWWQAAKDYSIRPAALPSLWGAFAREEGVPLARITLMLAWHSVRSDRYAACLVGISPAVAEIISNLPITKIDDIAERCFRALRPRWEDRPAVWRELLLLAHDEDFRRARDFNLYSLQLLTGKLLSPSAPFKTGPKKADFSAHNLHPVAELACAAYSSIGLRRSELRRSELSRSNLAHPASLDVLHAAGQNRTQNAFWSRVDAPARR